jgi:transposase|tara:strand:+ start:353 stop:703 length:351 start_codon:yes stop_codon:yes gene_type:complete
MLNSLNATIWLYCQPIDFRKQLDGLIVEVAATLQKDPTSGQLFVFRNKQANKIKIIVWEKNGFWMLYKRVEKGRFQFPEKVDTDIELTSTQLSWLLSGISIHQNSSITSLTPRIFY